MHPFDPAAVAGKTRGGIDNVDYIDGRPGLVIHPQPTIAPHGAPILVSGWTVDPATNGPAVAVCMLLDRVRPLETRTGIARGDIMVKQQTDEFVGYQLVVQTGDLGPGAHELRAFALGADGVWYESAAVGFRLFHPVYPSKQTLARGLRMFVRRPIDIGAGIEVEAGAPIRADRWFLFQGWTYDSAIGRGAPRIAACDDAGRIWSGPSQLEREDVRGSLNAADDRLGFEIAIPAGAFERGPHTLHITGFDDDGARYANALDVSVDIISAERPFPLTARATNAPPQYAARMRSIVPAVYDDLGEIETPEITLDAHALPARASIAADRTAHFVIEGWALDETGGPADEVFIELAIDGVHIPPQRLAAACARSIAPAERFESAPFGNAWFRFAFKTDKLQAGDYALALVVVQRGRNRFSRAPLGTLALRY